MNPTLELELLETHERILKTVSNRNADLAQ
jgi:hypothetical protein